MIPVFKLQIEHRFPTGFSLDVQLQSQHTSIGLSGPSGSGKTSIIHAIAGIFQPQSAQIQFGDQCFAGDGGWLPPRQRKIGLVTQDALLYPHLSVCENLGFSVHAQRPVKSDNAMVEMLEIEHLLDRRIRNLSGGERQRVALGRALLAKPQLLLADEPFSAVDIKRRSRIVEKLKTHLAETATAMMLVSHDRSTIDTLCSLHIELTQGSLRHKE